MVKILNAPKAYTLTGHVRTHPFVKSLPVGHNLLALPWPLNGSPATLGLDVEGGLTGGPTSDSADQLQLWKADSVPGLTSYDGYWLSPDSGWLPRSSTVAPSPGGPALPAHRAFFLKVQPATSAQGWLLPAPHVGQ